MGKLIVFQTTSLDGYVADRDGRFDWSAPGEEVHAFINDVVRSVGTFLNGRAMYEVMKVWEDPDIAVGEPPAMGEFQALWGAADKIVYSRTLPEVTADRTRLERELDLDALRDLKASADRDISVGGSDLAGQIIRAGLVDEWHRFLFPVVIGGGKPALPGDVRLDLELIDERRFGNGTVYLHYRTAGAPSMP